MYCRYYSCSIRSVAFLSALLYCCLDSKPHLLVDIVSVAAAVVVAGLLLDSLLRLILTAVGFVVEVLGFRLE